MSTLLTPRFIALMLAQASFGFAFSSFFVLPKFLATQLGCGPKEIGLVTMAFGATAVVFVPAMGAVVDRFGRKRFLTLGALLMAGTSLAFVWVETLGPFVYTLRVLHGIAFSMVFVAGTTLAVDEAPPDRLGQALGLFGLTFLSMNAIGPATAETIAEHLGWGAAWGLSAAAASLCALLSLRVQERRPTPAAGQTVTSLWEVAVRPRMLRIALIVALVGIAFGSMMTFHQPYALELGLGQVRAFFIAFAAAGVTARLTLGGTIDRAGRHRMTMAALVLYAGSVMAMVALRPDSLSLALHGASFGFAHGLFYPAFNALAIEGSDLHERGKVVALFNGAFNLGFAAMAPVLGALAEAAGFPTLFVATGTGVLVGLALLLASPEGRMRKAFRQAPAPEACEVGDS